MTQICPTASLGPDHGIVLFYDTDQKVAWVQPFHDIDCWITLQGQPNDALTPEREVTLSWRNTFRLDPYEHYNNTGTCPDAYIEIYNATDSGTHISPPVLGPLCGTSSPPDFTTTTQVNC